MKALLQIKSHFNGAKYRIIYNFLSILLAFNLNLVVIIKFHLDKKIDDNQTVWIILSSMKMMSTAFNFS